MYKVEFLNIAGKNQSPSGKLLWYKGWAYIDKDKEIVYIGRYNTIRRGRSVENIFSIGGIYTNDLTRSNTVKEFLKSQNINIE